MFLGRKVYKWTSLLLVSYEPYNHLSYINTHPFEENDGYTEMMLSQILDVSRPLACVSSALKFV